MYKTNDITLLLVAIAATLKGTVKAVIMDVKCKGGNNYYP